MELPKSKSSTSIPLLRLKVVLVCGSSETSPVLELEPRGWPEPVGVGLEIEESALVGVEVVFRLKIPALRKRCI